MRKLQIPTCQAPEHNGGLSLSGSLGRTLQRVAGFLLGFPSPLASSPRPPPGTWSGKTSIPSMPCSACACVLKRTRQGAGGFEALKPAVRAAGGLMDTGVRLLVPGGCAGWKAWGRVGGSGGPPSGASAPSVCGGALSGALDLGALGWMSYLHWFLEKVV